MNIVLNKLSKRFNRDWLFKDLDYQLLTNNSYAIIGPNGSGKTTLLKIIAGMIPSTRGNITYHTNGKKIDPDTIYQHLTFVAPYMDMLEDLTLREFYAFHFNFKPPQNGFSSLNVAENAGLDHAIDEPIRTFSSGMKQRAKLALGLYAATSILLLDEPTSNLDESGVLWYVKEIKRVKSEKLLIISSNQHIEYDFCDELIRLNIDQY
jgi:ABC-type multidrug transport system ATPase subunit